MNERIRVKVLEIAAEAAVLVASVDPSDRQPLFSNFAKEFRRELGELYAGARQCKIYQGAPSEGDSDD